MIAEILQIPPKFIRGITSPRNRAARSTVSKITDHSTHARTCHSRIEPANPTPLAPSPFRQARHPVRRPHMRSVGSISDFSNLYFHSVGPPGEHNRPINGGTATQPSRFQGVYTQAPAPRNRSRPQRLPKPYGTNDTAKNSANQLYEEKKQVYRPERGILDRAQTSERGNWPTPPPGKRGNPTHPSLP